ncbi:hypothetical protein IFM89_000449 [Coptis chinensis]|uniref:Dynein light chain n=1 Tax=Coptis chinensis TaxID=261450 RepID=A0A835I996_9MAGN|nr:hypothetical protein IFM89_000449 [Coptis chinensis]
MDIQGKQRRGTMSFFYNSGAGNRTPVVDLAKKAKKPLSRLLWGLRKPKVQNNQEIENHAIIKENEQVKKLVEARKSMSHIETNLTSVATFLHVKVLAVDMPGYMQVHAFRSARRTFDSLENFSSKHMAYNIKKTYKLTKDIEFEPLGKRLKGSKPLGKINWVENSSLSRRHGQPPS